MNIKLATVSDAPLILKEVYAYSVKEGASPAQTLSGVEMLISQKKIWLITENETAKGIFVFDGDFFHTYIFTSYQNKGLAYRAIKLLSALDWTPKRTICQNDTLKGLAHRSRLFNRISTEVFELCQ